MDCLPRRLDRAFSVYERNTGEPHPLALKRGHSNDRRIFTTVPLSLTRGIHVMTGDIQVGTPAQAFTGWSRFRKVQTLKLETNVQCISTRLAPTCSCMVLLARPAMDTKSLILPRVPPRRRRTRLGIKRSGKISKVLMKFTAAFFSIVFLLPGSRLVHVG